MWSRPSFIYSDIYYDQTLSLRIQVTNKTMDIPEREREIGGYREEWDKYKPQGINQNSLEMRMDFQSHCCNKWQYFRTVIHQANRISFQMCRGILNPHSSIPIILWHTSIHSSSLKDYEKEHITIKLNHHDKRVKVQH